MTISYVLSLFLGQAGVCANLPKANWHNFTESCQQECEMTFYVCDLSVGGPSGWPEFELYGCGWLALGVV